MLTQHPLAHAVPWVSSVCLSLEGLCNGGSLYSCSGSLRMMSAIGSKGECKNTLCVSPLGLPHRRVSRVSLRVCGQRLIEECVDVELSVQVPRTVSIHLGVRVVASGLATLRRCVLFSSCWVRYSMGCTRVRGARRGRGVRRSVLKQSVPWFTVHRWSSWRESPGTCGSIWSRSNTAQSPRAMGSSSTASRTI